MTQTQQIEEIQRLNALLKTREREGSILKKEMEKIREERDMEKKKGNARRMGEAMEG